MATQVRAFRIYTTTMALVSLATAGYLAVRYGLPALGPTLLFCSLTVYSEHRSVEFAEGAAMNAGFIVLMAAIVAFHGTSAALLGPLLVGMSKGIYVPHIRAHSGSL